MTDAQHTPIVERLRVSGDDLARIRWGEDRANVIKAADIITDLLEELEQQADGTSTIISLLKGQTGPVASSLIGMLRLQESSARTAISRARNGGEA